MTSFRWLAVGLALVGRASPGGAADPPLALANDNRVAAGRLVAGVREVSLELVPSRWRPGGTEGPAITVFAFAEAGRAPSIPGPLLRVVTGTMMSVTLTNRLDRRAVIRGLRDHDGVADSVVLAAGEVATVRFTASSPGTHYYWAKTAASERILGRTEDSQLVGAFLVDPAGTAPRPAERVLVISAFDDTLPTANLPAGRFQVFAINGRSWPATERLTASQGDTVSWRIINASTHLHPMHLHGFYFTVGSRGTPLGDTVYAAEARREGVTETLTTGTTASLTWVADRPGNWLYHCHMMGHIDGRLRLAPAPPEGMAHHRVEDVMSGLVVAVEVRPRGHPVASDDRPRRHLRLYVTERPEDGTATPIFGYVAQDGPVPPPADSVQRPGSTLVLRQGEPTEILVTNLARHATAVHWHGLELESYYDGVAGWSGAGARTAPLISPGDSFVVRLTPPRAGTFLYHTHADEVGQLGGGLFGAFLVVPRDAVRDPTERLLLFSDRGPEPVETPDGIRRPGGPVELRAGVAHRIRLASIGTMAGIFRVRLLADSTVQTWRPLAKDGADLPPGQAVEQPAVAVLGTGETFDVEIRRPRPERLVLELRKDGAVYYRVPVLVR